MAKVEQHLIRENLRMELRALLTVMSESEVRKMVEQILNEARGS